MRKCEIPDCPEQTGGKCWRDIPAESKEVVRELRTTRNVYRNFQADGLEYVTDPGWVMIIGVLDDRIEQLTGTRV